MRGFKGYINYLVGVLVFIAFVLLNLTTVNFGPQLFVVVLLRSGLMFICWVLIRNAFADQGLLDGQKDSNVQIAKRDHWETTREISLQKRDFEKWCAMRNKERLKERRIAILNHSSLNYKDYFSEEGNPLDKLVPKPEKVTDKKLYKTKIKRWKRDKKFLAKARKAFVPLYIAEEITAKEESGSKRSLFGLSIKQWKNVKLVSSVIISLVISVMLAFVIPSTKQMGKADIIIMVFQLLVMAASAFGFYFSATSFICNNWREDIVKKVRIMDEYYRACIGNITYENDREMPDGSRVLGKKIFTRTMPIVEEKEEVKQEKINTNEEPKLDFTTARLKAFSLFEETDKEEKEKREKQEGEEWKDQSSATNNETSASNT